VSVRSTVTYVLVLVHVTLVAVLVTSTESGGTAGIMTATLTREGAAMTPDATPTMVDCGKDRYPCACGAVMT